MRAEPNSTKAPNAATTREGPPEDHRTQGGAGTNSAGGTALTSCIESPSLGGRKSAASSVSSRASRRGEEKVKVRPAVRLPILDEVRPVVNGGFPGGSPMERDWPAFSPVSRGFGL